MKAFLFFLGTAIRSFAIRPSEFLVFHGYIFFVYIVAYIGKSASFNAFGLIFTSLVFAPLMFSIFNGLPLDFLNYESAIKKEVNK